GCRSLMGWMGSLAHPVAVRGDVGQDADCRRVVAEVVDRWGRIDALVNNAGRTRIVPYDDLDGLSAEDFEAIYRTNVVGTYQMTRAAAPHLRAHGLGAVVNVSSTSGADGEGSSMAYAASKGALNTLTLALARALAPQIRVNAVVPGFIASRWFADPLGPEGFDALVERVRDSTPLHRAGTPEDIAVSVVFLCDEGAEHVTGTTLVADAGASLRPRR
uniref:SDR family NAD(P)-dependent oxidoreductase n=1 Tax=Pseudonocardia pini TaxID=2758030 RepID=UPI0015F0763A